MNRLSDWDTALNTFLADRKDVPFSYGSNDCALFASDAVEAITGVDPAPDFRGKYKTKIGSFRALRNIGEGDLESTFDARFPVKPVSFAQRGDLVFDGDAVGVCVGENAVFVGEGDEVIGLGVCPMSEMKKAWAV